GRKGCLSQTILIRACGILEKQSRDFRRRPSMSKRSLYLSVSMMLLFSLSAFAVDGVVLINQASVIAAGGFPYTITQPGSYKLSSNLIVPLGKDGIDINAANVTVDLNGFSIMGAALCTGAPSPSCNSI